MSLLRLLVFSFVLSAAVASDGTSYRESLTAAEALAQEGSWDQAKTRYREALASAPDADARRWCELWIEDATWRSDLPNRWSEGEQWNRRQLGRYDVLEKPGHNDGARDEFWVALLTSRADLEENIDASAAWKMRAKVADHLAMQPPSETAAQRYIDFLRHALASTSRNQLEGPELMRPHLSHGARVSVSADDRAWCLWQLARQQPVFAPQPGSAVTRLMEEAQRWNAAVIAAVDTPWAPMVLAEELIWRTYSGWSPDAALNAPADVPAVLVELKVAIGALANDSTTIAAELRQQLESLARSLGEPRLIVESGTTFLPNSSVGFSYGASGLTRITARLERIAGPEWIALAPQNSPTRMAREQPVRRGRGAELVREWNLPVADPGRLAWHSEVVEAAPALPSGFYVLTLQGENPGGDPLSWQGRFTVSELRGLAILSSATEGKLFTFRAADGVPVVKAAVKGLTQNDSSVTPWEGITDSRGTVIIPRVDSHSRQVIADIGGEPIWIDHVGLFGEAPSLMVDAYTERPLFRPGETAHWKLIVREFRDGKFAPPRDVTGLNFRITHNGMPLVESAPVELNTYGSMKGEIKLPEDASAGGVILEIFREEPHGRRDDVAEASLFLIDRFVAPAVVGEVGFTGDAQSFRPGQEIAARIKASYFSGGPLPLSPVEARFSFENVYLFTGNSEFVDWARELSRQRHQVTSDPNGEATVKLSLPSFVPESTRLAVSVVITPRGAPPINASASVTISLAGVTLDPEGWTRPRLVRPGQQVTFPAMIRDGRGLPAAFKGRAELSELRWSEVWLDEAGRVIPAEELAETWRRNGGAGHRVPAKWRLVHAAYSETTVLDCPVTAAADGRISPAFTIPRAGIYRVRVFGGREILPKVETVYTADWFLSSRRQDSTANGLADQRRTLLSVLAADEQTSSLALNPESAAVVAPLDRDAERPLTVLGIVPEGAGRAWASLRGASEVLAEPVTLKGRVAHHTFQRALSLLGAGSVELAHASSDPTARGSVTARISAPSKQFTLDVAVAPTLDEQRPGLSGEVVFTVKDHGGAPAAAAQIAVSVTDESLQSLLGRGPDEPAPAFLGAHRIVPTRTLWSAGEPVDLGVIPDPRPGAVLNRHDAEEDEAIESYGSISLLAGARLGSKSLGFGEGTSGSIIPMDASIPSIQLRSHFASTAFWSPEVLTDANGKARVTFTYPDNLTRWRLAAYALGVEGTTFGTGNAFTRTALPFQARLQLPRLLITGDTAEPVAVLINRTHADLTAEAALEITGSAVSTDSNDLARPRLNVPQQSETHTRWLVTAEQPGEAHFTLTARTETDNDAMRLPLSVLEEGIQQNTAAVTRLSGRDKRSNFSLDLPATIDPARTQVSVYLSPNYAAAMLDALPYLVDYPYGCVEQTMNRFLPAIVVRQTLVDLGLSAEAVERRILASENAAAKKRREQSAGLHELDDVVQRSLSRLAEAQSPLGFGWWPGSDSVDLWMTAYVSWGLSLASSVGIDVPDELASSALAGVVHGLQTAGTLDDRVAFAWAALAKAPVSTEHLDFNSAAKLFSHAFAARGKLSPAGRACLALAARKFGTAEETATLVRNLDNGLQRASARGLGETVHWGETRDFWRAMDGAVESTALTLLALLELDPTSKLIEPAASWLVLNRRSSQWSSTRDTAFAVLALNAYLKQRGGLEASGEVELLANGKSLQRLRFSRDTLLDTPRALAVPAGLLKAGENKFQLRRVSGSNPVYATAVASSWARGDEVKPASHLLDVTRLFERQKAEPTLIGMLRITPTPLQADGFVQAGEEVTARITLNVPNDLEYVMIEVPKPAGCEPLNPLSGWDAWIERVQPSTSKPASPPTPPEGRTLYREERDDRSVFFLDRIEAGTWELRFGLRATVAGDYRALPVVVKAMYVPEIIANSDARRVRVERSP